MRWRGVAVAVAKHLKGRGRIHFARLSQLSSKGSRFVAAFTWRQFTPKSATRSVFRF